MLMTSVSLRPPGRRGIPGFGDGASSVMFDMSADIAAQNPPAPLDPSFLQTAASQYQSVNQVVTAAAADPTGPLNQPVTADLQQAAASTANDLQTFLDSVTNQVNWGLLVDAVGSDVGQAQELQDQVNGIIAALEEIASSGTLGGQGASVAQLIGLNLIAQEQIRIVARFAAQVASNNVLQIFYNIAMGTLATLAGDMARLQTILEGTGRAVGNLIQGAENLVTGGGNALTGAGKTLSVMGILLPVLGVASLVGIVWLVVKDDGTQTRRLKSLAAAAF